MMNFAARSNFTGAVNGQFDTQMTALQHKIMVLQRNGGASVEK